MNLDYNILVDYVIHGIYIYIYVCVCVCVCVFNSIEISNAQVKHRYNTNQRNTQIIIFLSQINQNTEQIINK